MWVVLKFLFIVGLFGAIAWAIIAAGGYSQGDKKPADSLAASTDFIRNNVFGDQGDRVEIVRPTQAEPETKGVSGFFKTTTRPATASGASYLPDTGPTTNEEASATWSGYYKEEHKRE